MNNAGYIFIMMFIFTVSLSGQTQYTFPRSGEGRFDRSNAIFWANPIFLKPAVFFSSSGVDIRANRKWWRNDGHMLPKPYIAHGYLPEGITLEECLNYKHSQSFVGVKKQSATQYLAEAGRSDKYKHIQVGFPKIQSTFNRSYPEKLQFTPNHYAQIALLKLESTNTGLAANLYK